MEERLIDEKIQRAIGEGGMDLYELKELYKTPIDIMDRTFAQRERTEALFTQVSIQSAIEDTGFLDALAPVKMAAYDQTRLTQLEPIMNELSVIFSNNRIAIDTLNSLDCNFENADICEYNMNICKNIIRALDGEKSLESTIKCIYFDSRDLLSLTESKVNNQETKIVIEQCQNDLYDRCNNVIKNELAILIENTRLINQIHIQSQDLSIDHDIEQRDSVNTRFFADEISR